MPALPKAVLFDLDDTLIRAYAQPEEAWTRLLHVFSADLDGKHLKRLTDSPGYDAECAYTPDGKHIVFCSDRGGNPNIYAMDADGGNLKQVGDDDGWNPAWSPDGKKILFTSLRSGDGFRVYEMNADGGNVKQLTNNANAFGSVYPCYSPDGKKIAIARGESDSDTVLIHDITR